MKAFLSYSTKDKRLAGKLATLLGKVGIEMFLAHHSVPGSDIFKDLIKGEIQGCDIFVLLLTKAFGNSDWTDQETGMAIAWNKRILPLKVRTKPYGFAADYQAVPFKTTKLEQCCMVIFESLQENYPHFREHLRMSVINSFCRCKSYYETRDLLLFIKKLRPTLTVSEKIKISNAARKNDQIRGFREVEDFVVQIRQEIESVFKGKHV